MAVSSLFGYAMTFLSSMAVLTILIIAWGYYSQPGGGTDLLPTSTMLLLNDYFPYVIAISLIIVLGEWTYKRPKKRKYDEEETYGALERKEGEGPPVR